MLGNGRKQMERTMRHILGAIDRCGELPKMNDDERYALKQCRDEGYVDGLEVAVMAGGRVVVEEACPKITLKGLKFLYPYRDWKFILPTTLAVGELAVIIVQTVVGRS